MLVDSVANNPANAGRLGFALPPKVSIVITHFNYSHLLEEALLSVFRQTYENWDCVVVDDSSEPEHLGRLETILADHGDRVRLVKNARNMGQIPSFYAGVDATDGEFVTLLDPDDRLDPAFMQDMVAAHLNRYVYAPTVSCDQSLVKNGSVITGVYSANLLNLLPRADRTTLPLEKSAPLVYFADTNNGWPWTSTSSLMLRRPAVEIIRPRRELPYRRAADSYLARGTHLLGGSLFLNKALVYRSLHADNSWATDRIFSIHQHKQKVGRKKAPRVKLDAVTCDVRQ